MSIANLFEENNYDLYANSLKFTDTAPAAALDVYDEQTTVIPVTGWPTVTSIALSWTRVGRVVTLFIPQTTDEIPIATAIESAVGAIPAAFQFSGDISFFIPVLNNQVSTMGALTLFANGRIRFGSSSGVVAGQPVPFSNAVFTLSAPATNVSGPQTTCVTYVV